ncbi:hypothetical protein EV359DRAFT_78297 [Lentinula novae-zelandiae]|nr:hypothetical protein EV359DRAFT_78297 [Lentinula novae-zelandiae]
MIPQVFVNNDARVYITSRRKSVLDNAVNTWGSSIAHPKGQFIALECDITDKKSIQKLVEEVEGREKNIDVLVNNAGVSLGTRQVEKGDESAKQLSEELFGTDLVKWEDVYRTTSAAPVHPGRTAAVINTTTMFGITGTSQHHFEYNVSPKLRLSILPPSLLRNSVEMERISESEIPTGDNYGERKGIPAGRPGMDEDIAQAVLMLACNQYAYGQTIAIDGGYLLHHPRWNAVIVSSEYTVPFQSAEFTNIDEYCIKNSIQFPSYRTETIIIRLKEQENLQVDPFVGIVTAWCTTCLFFATTNRAGLSTGAFRSTIIDSSMTFSPASSIFLLVLLMHSVAVYSSPVNLALLNKREPGTIDNNANATHDLYRRVDFDKPNLILGYLAVPQKTAEEFNAHGFTAIPVPRSSNPLGNDGTYVEATAIPDKHLPELVGIIFLGFNITLRESSQCAVFINTLEMVRTLRGFVDDVKSPAYNQPKYLTYFIEDLQKEWKNKGKHFVPGPPLLAARMQKGWSQLVVLVPYHYLLKSPSNPKQPSGANHLKLSLKCTPKGTSMDVKLPPPEWEQWGFEYWPKGLKS